MKPSFDTVGTLLAAAECLLLLEAPECRGTSRSLSGADCRVVIVRDNPVAVGEVDRRVLVADIDADLGLTTCVWDRIGQMARHSTPRRKRHKGIF